MGYERNVYMRGYLAWIIFAVTMPVCLASSLQLGNGAAGSDSLTIKNTVMTSGNPNTIYGVVYDTDMVTPLSGKAVSVSINGGTTLGVDYFTTTSDSDGVYGFTVLPTAGQRVLAFLEGETEKATTVMGATGSAIKTLNLYSNNVTIRDDNASAMTHAAMAAAKPAGKTDVLYSVSGSDLTVTTNDLLVDMKQRYAPEGNVSAPAVTIFGVLKPTAAVTVSSTVELKSTATVDLNGNNLVFSGIDGYGVVYNSTLNAKSLTVGDAGDYEWYGIIRDITGSTTSLVKVGAGSLELGGFNVHNGQTIINAGKIVVNSGANLGKDVSRASRTDLTINGGTLEILNSIVDTYRTWTIGASGGTIIIPSGMRLHKTTGGTVFYDYLTGSGALTITGGGMFEIYRYSSSSGGAISYTGDIEFTGAGTTLFINTRYQSTLLGGTGTITFRDGTNFWQSISSTSNLGRPLVFDGTVSLKCVYSSYQLFGSYSNGVTMTAGSTLNFDSTGEKNYSAYLDRITLLGDATINVAQTGVYSNALTTIFNDSGAGYKLTKTGAGTLFIGYIINPGPPEVGTFEVLEGTVKPLTDDYLPQNILFGNSSQSAIIDINGYSQTVTNIAEGVADASHVIMNSNTSNNATFTTINSSPNSFGGIITGTKLNLSISGAGSMTLSGSVSVQDLTIGTAHLIAGTDMEVRGNWVNLGTFTPGAYTVNITGATGSTSTLSGDTTFNNFACAVEGKRLTFEQGKTFSFSGLSLNGKDVASRIQLRSSLPGTQYVLALSAPQTVNWVNAQDANATTNNINAYNSFDAGNNSGNWIFN